MFKGTRRSVAAIAAVLGLGIGSAVWAASAASAAPASPAAAAAAAVPECTSSELAVWVYNNPGGGAAGSFDLPIGFTNISGRSCYLVGWPGVSATNSAGSQLGSAATRDATEPRKVVTLAPDATANADLKVIDVFNFTASACKPTTAALLKVFPPDQKSALTAFFSWPVCAKKGPVYLVVQRIRAGAPNPDE